MISQIDLGEVLRLLDADLPLADSAPGGFVGFRKTLARSFLFKFLLQVCTFSFIVPGLFLY